MTLLVFHTSVAHQLIFLQAQKKQNSAGGMDKLVRQAFWVHVPLLENDTEVVRAYLTFAHEVLKAIDREAKKRGSFCAAFLANAARHEIEI